MTDLVFQCFPGSKSTQKLVTRITKTFYSSIDKDYAQIVNIVYQSTAF